VSAQVLGGLACAVLLFMSSTPTPKIVQQQGFDVIGIAVRANNSKEMSGQGSIGAQWERFMKEGITGKIPNRVGDTIYALYTGYAKDRNGDYDFVIGMRVSVDNAVPPGMILKHVPAGKYAVVTSDKGPGFQVVPAAWQRIWQMEDSAQLGGLRSYATDYEVYDERARDPQAGQVDIFVGIQ
jgi:predicted transcriptional regulator YdeE